MKNIIFIIALLLSSVSYSQMADYGAQELTLNVNQTIGTVELCIIIDDIYLEVLSYEIEDNKTDLKLYLTETLDYHLIINGEIYMSLSVKATDIIDEQDIDISADTDFEFDKGILVFNY